MTVKELLGRIDSHEFTEWMAYDNIDPFGEGRADLRAAVGHAQFYNANRGENAPEKKLEDFMFFSQTSDAPPKPLGLGGAEGAALAKRMFRNKDRWV